MSDLFTADFFDHRGRLLRRHHRRPHRHGRRRADDAALIFLGVGGGSASTVVTADLTAAAIYKTGGAIVHARDGAPNWTLASWLIAGSVPFALVGPWLRAPSVGELPPTSSTPCSRSASASRCCSPPRRTPSGSTSTCAACAAAAPADPDPTIRPVLTVAGRRPRRAAGRRHQRRLGLGDHDRAAACSTPGSPRVRLVGTDLVQAVPLVIAAADLQHHPERPRLAHPDPAGHRLAAGHHARQQDRAAGAAVVHPPRDRGGAHDVGLALLDKAGWAPLGAGRHTPTRS